MAFVDPTLAQLMSRQRGVFTRAQALACSYDDAAIKRLRRSGEWVALRHGIYTTGARKQAAEADPRRNHLLHAAAARLAFSGDTVLSHGSAAVWHRLPIRVPSEPELTRHRPDGGGRMTAHGLYVAAVPTEHRVAGLPVTMAGRTVADCARALPTDDGFVLIESALRLGLERLSLLDVLAFCAGWPNAADARDLVIFASRWSESPLESRARLWFQRQGLPQPQQQRVVLRAEGGFVARVDFLWEQYRTVCEVDGRMKYDDAAAEPLWREKLREDELRDLGLEVVRGYWSDGDDLGERLAGRLRRAFARGLRAGEEPAYRIIAPPEPAHRPLAVAV
jgi:hypothetical protein